jgi:hypothetical protein
MIPDTGTLGTHGDLCHTQNVLSSRGLCLPQEELVPVLSLQPQLGVPWQLVGDRLPSRFLLRQSLIMHVLSLRQRVSLTWCRLLVEFVCPRFSLPLIPYVVAMKYHLHIDIFKTNPTCQCLSVRCTFALGCPNVPTTSSQISHVEQV